MQLNNAKKQLVQDQFGQNAEKYVSSEGHAHGSDLELGIEWLQPTSEDAMLDIATGGGHVARTLAPFVHNVTVTDLTVRMLETARNHLTEHGVKNAQYVLADAEDLPFLSNSFDIVTCRIAPHHFPNPEAFIREVARVLRPNGRFMLVDNVAPNNKSLSDFVNLVESIRDPSHVECLAVVHWRRLLTEQGFTITQDIVRKKTHLFGSWVDRMVPTEAHRLAVSSMLLNAPQEAQTYFEIVVQDKAVLSFATDEWVATAVKN